MGRPWCRSPLGEEGLLRGPVVRDGRSSGVGRVEPTRGRRVSLGQSRIGHRLEHLAGSGPVVGSDLAGEEHVAEVVPCLGQEVRALPVRGFRIDGVELGIEILGLNQPPAAKLREVSTVTSPSFPGFRGYGVCRARYEASVGVVGRVRSGRRGGPCHLAGCQRAHEVLQL